MHRLAVRLLSALVCVSLPAMAPAAAEVTRTLRVELPAGSSGPFAIENLAGSMKVVRGSGAAVVAIATVHAEDQSLADAMRFEEVRGGVERPTWRVRYPLDRQDTLRYPGGTTTKYDGHRVSVSSGSGVLLYADVEIQVPARRVEAHFRNVVGPLRAEGIEGTLRFDTDGGDVKLDGVRGEVRADTGSGDVKVTGGEGSLTCDTGSGDCDISGFHGEQVVCDVGSGHVRALEIDVEEFDADTGSGNVELAVSGGRLARVSADTGSGDVTLRLGPDASFEALADQGSGDITNRYADAQPILKHKELIGYRRGDGRIRITVDTGSGDFTIEPGNPTASNHK
jgi:Putative adhesin